jgi:hypothetical protein
LSIAITACTGRRSASCGTYIVARGVDLCAHPKVADCGPIPAPPKTIVVFFFAFIVVCSLGGACHHRGNNRCTQLVVIVSRARLHKPSGSFTWSFGPGQRRCRIARSSVPTYPREFQSPVASPRKIIQFGAWSVEACLSALREIGPAAWAAESADGVQTGADCWALSRDLSRAIQPKQNVDQNYNSGSLPVYSPKQYPTPPKRKRAVLQT